MPINKNLHWSLAVVAYPGALRSRTQIPGINDSATPGVQALQNSDEVVETVKEPRGLFDGGGRGDTANEVCPLWVVVGARVRYIGKDENLHLKRAVVKETRGHVVMVKFDERVGPNNHPHEDFELVGAEDSTSSSTTENLSASPNSKSMRAHIMPAAEARVGAAQQHGAGSGDVATSRHRNSMETSIDLCSDSDDEGTAASDEYGVDGGFLAGGSTYRSSVASSPNQFGVASLRENHQGSVGLGPSPRCNVLSKRRGVNSADIGTPKELDASACMEDGCHKREESHSEDALQAKANSDTASVGSDDDVELVDSEAHSAQHDQSPESTCDEDSEEACRGSFPCILFFDSLQAHDAVEASAFLREWLNHEWASQLEREHSAANPAAAAEVAMAKEACSDAKEPYDEEHSGPSETQGSCASVESVLAPSAPLAESPLNRSALEHSEPGPLAAIYNEESLPLIEPDVPRQSNSWDCGVFVLEYGDQILDKCPDIPGGRARTHKRNRQAQLDRIFGRDLFRSDVDIIQRRGRLRELVILKGGDAGAAGHATGKAGVEPKFESEVRSNSSPTVHARSSVARSSPSLSKGSPESPPSHDNYLLASPRSAISDCCEVLISSQGGAENGDNLSGDAPDEQPLPQTDSLQSILRHQKRQSIASSPASSENGNTAEGSFEDPCSQVDSTGKRGPRKRPKSSRGRSLSEESHKGDVPLDEISTYDPSQSFVVASMSNGALNDEGWTHGAL